MCFRESVKYIANGFSNAFTPVDFSFTEDELGSIARRVNEQRRNNRRETIRSTRRRVAQLTAKLSTK